MLAGVPKETFPGERRVAVIPTVLPSLAKLGIEVLLEAGAGAAAGFPDETYVEKGARVANTRDEVFAPSSLILQARSQPREPRTQAGTRKPWTRTSTAGSARR